MQKLQAKISLNSIAHNARAFKNLTKKKLCAVVKANAYGHGAEEVVNALNGIADCFAVALIEEAISIRVGAADKEILVLTPPSTQEEALALAENKCIATIPDVYTAKLLSATCKQFRLPLKVHLKGNTGMNRYGANASNLGKICSFLQGDSFLSVCGFYSHLYGDYFSALEQRELFLSQQRVCKKYFPNLCCHLSATSGSLYGEDFAFDMTRVGLGLYGYLPPKLEEEARKVGETLDLKKAMRIYGKVLFSRRVSFGGLGYGNSLDEEKLKKKEKVSLLRFGYADGFLRTKRNGVEGYAKNANNLCMDASIQWGEKKRGKQVPLMLNADQTAEIAGTISYEVLCAATRRAEFIYED